jgi:hypothetical protein
VIFQDLTPRFSQAFKMPTVFRYGPYRFFFYAGDRSEPVHVHVERDAKIAKFWVAPCKLEASGGFNRAELAKIQKIVKEYQADIEEAWHGYFNG